MQALTSFMMITNTIYVILVPLLVITIMVLGIMALIRYNRAFLANQKKDEKLKKSLGEILKDYRLKAGMSQEYVAHELGVSRQAISKWERGVSDPSTTNLLSLANLYGFKVDEILKQIVQHKNISWVITRFFDRSGKQYYTDINWYQLVSVRS